MTIFYFKHTQIQIRAKTVLVSSYETPGFGDS